MFVASSLFNYATSKSSTSASNPTSTPSATRVKRHPNKKPSISNPNLTSPTLEDIPPPSYASVASSNDHTSQTELAKRAIVDSIIEEPDLYKVLGVGKKAKVDEIRRGFLNRSRVCHPDKFPNYPPSTLAFQRVSFAYETLSKPNSRRIYDVSGRHDLAAAMNGGGSSNSYTGTSSGNAGMGMESGDETLNGVLYSVFCEFLEGDFEMIRVLVSAMNEGNPGLNLGEDAVESLEGAFKKMREFMLNGKKYLSIIRFELIRLYEIQHSLRQLSYFDVFGRLRLTMRLARVTIGIPLAIDQAMKDGKGEDKDYDEGEEEEEGEGDEGEEEGEGDRRARWQGHEEEEFGMAEDSENEETLGEKFRKERREMKERERKLKRQNLKNGFVNRSPSSSEIPNKTKRKNKKRDNFGDRSREDSNGSRETGNRSRENSRDDELQEDEEENEEEEDQENYEGEEEIKKKPNRGLFGNTTSSLLGGVVKVLETSEGWVPGSKRNQDD